MHSFLQLQVQQLFASLHYTTLSDYRKRMDILDLTVLNPDLMAIRQIPQCIKRAQHVNRTHRLIDDISPISIPFRTASSR